ncbi:MAG: Gfo/Idh/MocA family oxidoreductase [Phycisphaerales bacterium]|nr:MAG: Gfo/Idh/MocA family oxidoreductase [Phycisphaerales bacterium]
MATQKLTRREFIGRSAITAAALPTIVPSTVFGQNAPSNRVTLASCGVGSQGSYLMRNFTRLSDAQFLAVCDTFKSRRDEAARVLNRQYGGSVVQAYEDFRNVLDRDDIDAVIIATPDHWHVPLANCAAKAGKDVYVEKPLGPVLRWAGELRRTARRYGTVFQYGTQQRSDWRFRYACELARNGYIGELDSIEVWSPDVSDDWNDFAVKRYGSMEPAPIPEGFNYDLWLGPAPWAPYTIDRCRREGSFHVYDYALGFIAGWGAHPLDIAQWGNDADHTGPVSYEGSGEIPTDGLLNTVAQWDVRCQYPNGVIMRFMCHRLARPVVEKYRPWSGHGTTFFGSEGWVSVDRGGLHFSRPALKDVTFSSCDSRLYESTNHYQNFLDCIKSRQPTISPLEAAIRSDTISHLSDICIRLRQPINWDAQNELIVGNEYASRMLDRAMRSPWRL